MTHLQIFSLFFCAAGALMIGIGIRFLLKFFRFRGFPSTEGVVLSKEIIPFVDPGHGKAFVPQITFSYTVAGQKFTSDKFYSFSLLNLRPPQYASPDKAGRQVSEFAPGGPIHVAFDPADPGIAFIRNGSTFQIYAPIILGMAFCALGWFFYLHRNS